MTSIEKINSKDDRPAPESRLHGCVFGVLRVLGLAVLATVGLIGFITVMNWEMDRDRKGQAEALAPMAERLETFKHVALGGQQELHSEVKPRSPIVLVTVSENQKSKRYGSRIRRAGFIDGLHTEVSKRLLTDDASQVRSVVGLNWGEKYIGKYPEGAVAYQETCRVEVFDVNSGRLLARSEFVGGQPPASLSSSGRYDAFDRVFGTGCDKQIIRYLESLFPPDGQPK